MGAGRIGKMHAEIISSHPDANLKFVYDVNKEFASKVAKQKIMLINLLFFKNECVSSKYFKN